MYGPIIVDALTIDPISSSIDGNEDKINEHYLHFNLLITSPLESLHLFGIKPHIEQQN